MNRLLTSLLFRLAKAPAPVAAEASVTVTYELSNALGSEKRTVTFTGTAESAKKAEAEYFSTSLPASGRGSQ